MMYRTGFGQPDTQAFAYFSVLIQGREPVYPDWDVPTLAQTKQYAGGSSYVTQVSGFGPATLALKLQFDTRAEYVKFNRLRSSLGTLRLIAGYTSHDGARMHYGNLDYEDYDDTLLLQVSQVQHEIDGGIECMAIFQRAWEPRLQDEP